MYRTDNSTSATAKPTRGAVGPNPDAFYVDGTVVERDHMNAIQDEICEVVEQAGLTLDKTLDNQLHTAIGLLCDTEMVTVTGGTNALTKTDKTLYTYNIADFTGTGVNTDEIRGVHVKLTGQSAVGVGGIVRLYASYPTAPSTLLDASLASIGSSGSVEYISDIVFVPVNKNQTSFQLQIDYPTVGSFEIFAVTQRTFS